MKPAKNLQLLSLFCGAGGLDLGFEDAGFEASIAFDIRKDAVASFNANRPSPNAHVQDIRQLTANDIDNLLGRSIEPVGVIGGPPCQSFSVSNTKSSDDDPRHELPTHYARLISELNARKPLDFFVFENVPGLEGTKHEFRFQKFLRLFKKAGFNIFKATLNAADYGVAQNRERLIIVGYNKQLHPNKKWTPPARLSQPTKKVEDVIRELPEPTYFARDLSPESIAFHANHWCMVPRSKKFFTPGALVPEKGGRSFRTLSWDKPSPTVAYGNREVHVHPDGKRRLSVFEAMLLQGFPREYVLRGNLSSQILQVSEAVPPPMAANIAQSIISDLFLAQEGQPFATQAL